MARRLIISSLFFLFLLYPAFSQEGLPIIKQYSVENYQAGIENWDAVQDEKGLIYFANSEGILEFDGVHWRLIRTQKRSNVRSLSLSENDIIYAAGDNDFGYLAKDRNGQRSYVSLAKKCPAHYRYYLSHMWKALTLEGKKFFLGNGAVLVFDENNEFIKILEEDIYLRSLFLIDNRLYGYSNKKGILVFDPSKLEFTPFCQDELILDRYLEFIEEHPEGGIRIHIFEKGFYRLYKGKLSFEKKISSKPVDTDYIFCQEKTGDLLFLGTTTNGLYALSNASLDIRYHFEKHTGLSDNKIFAVYADHNRNIWVCHENGLSYIEMNSPVRLINERLGINGTGYCNVVFDSTLFVGTSHGLFVSPLGKDHSFYGFSLFRMIRQPIYFLEKRENTLLIGCLLEMFEYDGKELKQVIRSRNNNKILALPDKPGLYLVSTSNGFLLLEYRNGFRVIRKVEGIDGEIRDFVTESDGTIWAINSKQQLLMAAMNSSMDFFEVNRNFKEHSLHGLKFSSLSVFRGKLVAGTNEGLFTYDRQSEDLKRVSPEDDKFPTAWLYNQDNEDLWYEKTFFQDGKLFYKIDIFSRQDDQHKANRLNSVIYGNKAFSFGKLNETRLIIGTSEGFLLFNLDFDAATLDKAETYIRKIRVNDAENSTVLEGVWSGAENRFELPLHEEVTEIELDCAANYFYSGNKVQYSYKLGDTDADWKEWTKDNTIRYTIHGDGKFTFHLRARSNYSPLSKITSYDFTIKKPWYKTYWWYGIEIGFLVVVMLVSAYFNRKGSSKISRISAFVLILIILTVFEIFSEIVQDWVDAQGVTIFALKIAINISIALSISPVENWLRKKLIRPVPQKTEAEKDPV